MPIIYGFFILVEALVSVLLIAIVLVQKSKGGMGGSAFGGGMGEAIFGSRMGNVLTKATVVLGIIFLVNTVLLTIFTARRSQVSGTGSVTDGQTPITQAAPLGEMPPMDMPMTSEDVPVESDVAPVELPPVEVDVVAPIEIPAPEDVPVVPAPESIPTE